MTILMIIVVLRAHIFPKPLSNTYPCYLKPPSNFGIKRPDPYGLLKRSSDSRSTFSYKFTITSWLLMPWFLASSYLHARRRYEYPFCINYDCVLFQIARPKFRMLLMPGNSTTMCVHQNKIKWHSPNVTTQHNMYQASHQHRCRGHENK